MTQTAIPTSRPRRGINLRLVVFGAVVLFVVGAPAYIYIKEEITGGIVDAGDGYKLVNLKAMSSFDFDQTHGRIEDIPARWRALNGQKVVLYGEIAPNMLSAKALNEFDLVYSVQQCCFSGDPQIQHFIQSRLSGNRRAPNFAGLVKVKGTLHVGVEYGNGRVTSVYRLDVESVEPTS